MATWTLWKRSYGRTRKYPMTSLSTCSCRRIVLIPINKATKQTQLLTYILTKLNKNLIWDSIGDIKESCAENSNMRINTLAFINVFTFEAELEIHGAFFKKYPTSHLTLPIWLDGQWYRVTHGVIYSWLLVLCGFKPTVVSSSSWYHP